MKIYDESALMQILQKVWDPITWSNSKGVLERCFLESGPTMFFTVCNFGNKVAMKIIFFSKCVKFDEDSRNGTKKSERVFRLIDNRI